MKSGNILDLIFLDGDGSIRYTRDVYADVNEMHNASFISICPG